MWVFAFKAGFLNKFTNLKGENMNQERTFGVEMEMSSAVSLFDVSTALNTILQPFGHHSHVEGYGHATNGLNFTEWVIKSDSSIGSRHGFHDCEVVTPVMKGLQGLEILKAVCTWFKASGNFKITRSCGLHVHHGVRASELKNLAKTWLRVEKVVEKSLPGSRKMNKYCAMWNQFVLNGCEEMLESIPALEWYDRYVGRVTPLGFRYSSLNYKSFSLRGTVEFRCAAGSFEYSKIANWVLLTQAIIENSNTIPIVNFTEIEEFTAWLNGHVTRNSIPENSNGNASVFGNHRRNTASAMVDEMLREGIHLHEAVARLQAAFANYANKPKQAERKFKGHVCHLLQNNVNIQRTGTYYVYVAAIHETAAMTTVDNQYSQAIAWLETRYAQFCNVVGERNW
jgi:hypothetical protein